MTDMTLPDACPQLPVVQTIRLLDTRPLDHIFSMLLFSIAH
jgi:hypothetical protein